MPLNELSYFKQPGEQIFAGNIYKKQPLKQWVKFSVKLFDADKYLSSTHKRAASLQKYTTFITDTWRVKRPGNGNQESGDLDPVTIFATEITMEFLWARYLL